MDSNMVAVPRREPGRTGAARRMARFLLLVPLALALVVPVQLAPGSAGAAHAVPPECDGKWRYDGVWAIGGKTSNWIRTINQGWDAQYVKFRGQKSERYSRGVWNGKTCKIQRKWNKGADRYRIKGCLESCSVSPWRTWRKPYGLKLKYLGRTYAKDPVSGTWMVGW